MNALGRLLSLFSSSHFSNGGGRFPFTNLPFYPQSRGLAKGWFLWRAQSRFQDSKLDGLEVRSVWGSSSKEASKEAIVIIARPRLVTTEVWFGGGLGYCVIKPLFKGQRNSRHPVHFREKNLNCTLWAPESPAARSLVYTWAKNLNSKGTAAPSPLTGLSLRA